MTVLILSAAAFASSMIAGFLGLAGGITLLAVMTIVMPASIIIPIHGIVQLMSNFTRTILFVRHVHWRIFTIFAFPMIFGMFAATLVWSGVKIEWLKPIIGIYLIVFLVWRRFSPKLRNIPLWIYAPLGLACGFISIFVGAIGPFIAPFFLRDDFEKEQVIATKAVCQAWGHLLKIPAFLSLGFNFSPHWKLLVILLACVIAGTIVGKRLLSRISKKTFILCFEIALAIIATHLISTGLL